MRIILIVWIIYWILRFRYSWKRSKFFLLKKSRFQIWKIMRIIIRMRMRIIIIIMIIMAIMIWKLILIENKEKKDNKDEDILDNSIIVEENEYDDIKINFQGIMKKLRDIIKIYLIANKMIFSTLLNQFYALCLFYSKLIDKKPIITIFKRKNSYMHMNTINLSHSNWSSIFLHDGIQLSRYTNEQSICEERLIYISNNSISFNLRSINWNRKELNFFWIFLSSSKDIMIA